MTYLQIGAPKSGNFWLRKILQNTRAAAGLSNKNYITTQSIYAIAKNWKLNFPEQSSIDVVEIDDLQTKYRISSIFQMPVEDMADYTAQTDLVWTHSRFNPRTPAVLRHFSKKIYIVRDPRDRLISASRYYTSPYMLKYFPQPETFPAAFLKNNFEKLLHEWVWHVYDYLRFSESGNIHFCFFEGFRQNFKVELGRLCRYLDLDLNADQMQQVQDNTTFRALKTAAPDHLVRGKSGQWSQCLPADFAEAATAYTAPLLNCLGYNENGWDRDRVNFTKVNFEDLKADLFESQKTPLPNSQLPADCF